MYEGSARDGGGAGPARPAPPHPPEEDLRLAELRACGLDGPGREAAFDDLAHLALGRLGGDVGLVTFVGAERRWIRGAAGPAPRDEPRDDSLCAWAIGLAGRADGGDGDAGVLVVPDTLADPRVSTAPAVAGPLGVRSYVGAVIRSVGGRSLGTVCVLGAAPRPDLDDAERAALVRLARQAGRVAELRRTTTSLADLAARTDALLAATSDVVVVVDAAGRIAWVSASVGDLLGGDVDRWTGTPADALVHPDDRAAVADSLRAVARREELPPLRLRLVADDGTVVPVEAVASDQLATPGVHGFVVSIRDVRHRVEMERDLTAERSFLRALLDSLDVGIVACDADGALTLVNPATAALHGLPGAQLPPPGWAAHDDLTAVDGSPLAPEDVPLRRAFVEGEVRDAEVVIAPEGAPPRLVSCTGRAIVDDDGERLGAVVAMHDVTEQRAAEGRLRELADRDPLTGLHNRAVLLDAIRDDLAAGHLDALLFLDLDGFKAINDRFGHAVGDRALVAVAERLVAGVARHDLVARLGGDEFVVLARDVRDGADARRLGDRLERLLDDPVVVGGARMRLGASVGVAVPEDDSVDAEGLLVDADRAMYLRKAQRRA